VLLEYFDKATFAFNGPRLDDDQILEIIFTLLGIHINKQRRPKMMKLKHLVLTIGLVWGVLASMQAAADAVLPNAER